MSNLRIVYDNLVDRGTVSTSSTAGALVAANLQTDTKSDVWRATALAASIYAAWPTADTIQAVALPFCNLSPTATMRVRATNETSIVNYIRAAENFESTLWTQAATTIPNSVFVQPYAATAPDGTLTAALLRSQNTGNDFIYQAPPLTTGMKVVFSLYVKNIDATASQLMLRTTATAINGFINWSGATLTSVQLSGAGVSSGFAAVPNAPGWYRVWFYGITSESSQNVRIYPDKLSTGKSIYAWGAQYEVGTTVTSYFPSADTFTSRAAGTATYFGDNGAILTAASGAARLSYNPYNLSAAPALLVEAAATNLVTASGAFTTGWTGNVSVATTTGLYYRGYETYKKLAKTTTSTNEQKAFAGLGAVAAGNSLTATIALRDAGQGVGVAIGLYDTTSGGTAWGVNADSKCTILEGPGTVGAQSGGQFVISNLSATADTLVQITRAYTTAATTTSFLIYPGGTGSITVGAAVLATRVQVEAGTFPTSYIPTGATTVTRAADVWNSVAGVRPTGYLDTWQTYAFDSGVQLACPAPALRPRGWLASQAASAYAYGGGAYARMWLPAPMQATGVAVDIADANNMQGYIEAARLVVGPYWSPTYNASEASMSVVDTAELYRTDAGDQGASAGYQYRRVPLSLSAMPAVDRAAFVNIVRNSRAAPILLSVFPDSTDLALERDHMVYGRRTKDSDVAIQYAASYSTAIEIEEI